MENDDETELVLFEEMKVETCYECEHFGVAECQEICEETAPARNIVDSRIDIWSTPDVNKKCKYGVLQMSIYN